MIANGPGIFSYALYVGRNLTLDNATVTGNSGNGIGLAFPGSVRITDSDVSDNLGSGVGLVDGRLDISGSSFHGNGGNGARNTGQGSGSMTVSDSSFTDNGATGLACSNCGDLTVTDSVITGNGTNGAAPDGGISVATDIDDPADSVTIALTDVLIADNSSVGNGGGLSVTVTEALPAGPIAQTVLERTTVSGNTSAAGGGGIFSASGDVELRNSTVSGNTAATGAGSILVPDHQVRLRHASVVDGNGAGTDTVDAAAFDAFGSIIATAGGADPDCTVGGPASIALSLDGDGSCGASVSGDPLLDPLADNSGATPTRLPAAASPVLGLVPAAMCTVLSTDQRRIARPQGPDCEAGSVEVAESAPAPACTVTGTPGNDILVGTAGPDIICGLGGNDLIIGLDGADTLLGGSGRDTVLGGGGDDLIRGGSERDLLSGGSGADTIEGGLGNDILLGGPGPDIVRGGPGGDFCVGETKISC